MSASKEAKAIGLPSIRFVSKATDTKESVLYDWYNNKPKRFKALIHGVKDIEVYHESNK